MRARGPRQRGRQWPGRDRLGNNINRLIVSPNFFDVMGIPLMLGRRFTDNENNPAAREATRQPAFRMTLPLGFAAVSLLLAAIGTFGLVSQAVTQGLREIAIRLVLGAEPAAVVRAIVRRALSAASAGLVIGAVAAFSVGNALEAMIYGLRPRDAMSFVAAGMTLLVVTAVGAIIPTLRAIHVDPVRVLRPLGKLSCAARRTGRSAGGPWQDWSSSGQPRGTVSCPRIWRQPTGIP